MTIHGSAAFSPHHGVTVLARERDLHAAPRIAIVDPEMIEAVELAQAHARQLLRLTPLRIVWCSRPGGYCGQTLFFPDGRAEIRLNAASDMSARETASVVLHEAKHVADGPRLCGSNEELAERRANDFAAFAGAEWRTPDFCGLNWRRPSTRR